MVRFILVLWVMVASASAQSFQITGPDYAVPGSLVRLTVAEYEPTDVRWLTVRDSQKYGLNGAELVFAMPNGPVIVTCAVISREKLYLAQRTIENAPSEPLASSGSILELKPVEPKIEPLSEKIITIAHQNNLSPKTAQQIATNLREAANDAKNPRGLVKTTARLNRPLDLPDKVDESIEAILQTMAEEGSLKTLEQHLEVWEKIAKGFETVK